MGRANLPAKKYKKSNPTTLRLSFEGTGSGNKFIDIAQSLSMINRKFYRQGVYYYVNSIEVYNNEQGVYDFLTVPDTWVTKNSWNRGFQLFQKMNSMVDPPVSNVGRSKYHDFKVYMSREHATTLSVNKLMPAMHGTGGMSPSIQGQGSEWTYSQFVSADDDGDSTQDADEFTVHIVGSHDGSSSNWNSIGLIKSYGESRRTVEDRNDSDDHIQSDDPLLNIFDMSSEEQMNDIIDNLLTDNDLPPYNPSTYVGEDNAEYQHVARVGTEVGLGRVGKAAGFCVPFGLLALAVDDVSSDWRVVLNLAPGTYHGVYAERA